MIKRLQTDKRRFPRVKKELPLKIAANGYDFTTDTQNVSCVGTYCRVDKYLPPFTKVLIKLSLPITNKDNNNCCVECKGVIVRTEDEDTGGFNLAIFFNEIAPAQKRKISQYINQFLPQKSYRP